MKCSILVVDDEPAQRLLLAGALGSDYDVVAAADGLEATQILGARSFDLVITDERMPRMSGIELIRWVREKTPETPVVVLTAYGSVESAVEAIKLGAEDYLTKPLKSPEEIRMVVSRVLRERRLRDREIVHRAESEALFPQDIVAESDSMKRVLTLAAQVAAQPTTVLLTGESGTGKEIVARYIHRRSPRAAEPFVAVNCAALTETLLESELFGHEKGAFTGAIQSKRGRFELAHGGTLFLDEVAEMSLSIQPKLLRVLQEQQFERVGGTRTIVVDVRVVAATNKDLAQAMEEKIFREDLYYRLNVFPIHIPPLRERREDIIPLAEHFARRIAGRMGKRYGGIDPEARQLLLAHPWPGIAECDRAHPHRCGRGCHQSRGPAPAARRKSRRARARRHLGGNGKSGHTRGAATKQRRPQGYGGTTRHQPAHPAIPPQGIQISVTDYSTPKLGRE